MLCDANGVPLRFLLSCGQASDIAYAQPLLDRAYAPSLRGRPRKRCRWLLADKGNVEGEPPHRYTVRQAREKFCGDGLIGLCHAVFATLLFVQSLRQIGFAPESIWFANNLSCDYGRRGLIGIK